MASLKTVPELAVATGLPPSLVFNSVAGYQTDPLIKDHLADKSTLLQTDAFCSVILADKALKIEYKELRASHFVGVPLSDLFTMALNPHIPQDKRTEMSLVPGMPSYAIFSSIDGKRLTHRANQKDLLLRQPVPKLAVHFHPNTYLPVYRKSDQMHTSHINLNYLNFRSAPFNVLPLFDFQAFVHPILLFADQFNYYVAFNEDFATYYDMCVHQIDIPCLTDPICVPEMDDDTIVIDCSKVGRLISRLYTKGFSIYKDYKWERFCDIITVFHYVNGIVDALPEYFPAHTTQVDQETAARIQNLAASTSHMALIIEDGEDPLEMVSILQEAFGAQLRFKPDFYLSDSILGSEDLVSFLLPDMVYNPLTNEYLYLPELIGSEDGVVLEDSAPTNLILSQISRNPDSWRSNSLVNITRICPLFLAHITGISEGATLGPADTGSGSILDRIRRDCTDNSTQLMSEIREKLFGFSERRWNTLKTEVKQAWMMPNRSSALASLNLKAFSTAASVLTKDYVRVLNWCPGCHAQELIPSFLASQKNARSSWLALRTRSFAKYLLEVSPDVVAFQRSDFAEFLDAYLYENEVSKYVFIHTRVCPQWPFVTLDKSYVATFFSADLGKSVRNTQKCPFDGHYTTETSTIAFNSEKYELISYDNIYLSNVLSMSWLNEASPAIWKRFLSENTATICLLKHKKLESTYLVVLSVACTRDSDPVTTIQVLYSEYYFYRFIQKQVADGRVNLARDSVLYVMAGQICGGVEEPSYRMLTGGNRWTSTGNELVSLEASYNMVRQVLKRYDEQHQQSVEGADMLPTDRSYESLFAAIVHEKDLLDLICRNSNLVRTWIPVHYDDAQTSAGPEASVMWDSESYNFYLAAAEEDRVASAKLAVFGVL